MLYDIMTNTIYNIYIYTYTSIYVLYAHTIVYGVYTCNCRSDQAFAVDLFKVRF